MTVLHDAEADETWGIYLIECLVVISIIAILTAMAVPSFRQLKDHAQQLQVIYQLHAAVLVARHLSIISTARPNLPRRAGMKIETSQSPACDENLTRASPLGGVRCQRLHGMAMVVNDAD